MVWGTYSQKALSIGTGLNRWGIPVIMGPSGVKYRRLYLGRRDKPEKWELFNAKNGENPRRDWVFAISAEAEPGGTQFFTCNMGVGGRITSFESQRCGGKTAGRVGRGIRPHSNPKRRQRDENDG